MATRLGAAPIRRARQLLSAVGTTAMAWLLIFRSGAQSPQRQQPARRQTHEFSWWKGGVTMRGCPSTGSGVPCCEGGRDDASTAREGLSREPVGAVHQGSEAEYIILAETKSPSIVRRLHGRSRRQGRRRGWQDAAAGELAEECQPVDPEVQPAPRVTSEVAREGPIVAERAHDHLARVRVGFAPE